MRNIKNERAFTLAEVLITLGIIGVVAALTLPSLIQNYKNKELITRTKRTYSNIQNAVLAAQQDNGNIGDNSALFDYSDGYAKVTENLSKYFNSAQYCKTKTQAECSNFYYNIAFSGKSYDSTGTQRVDSANGSKIILNDGAILYLSELIPNCDYTRNETHYNDKGESSIFVNHVQYCAIIHFDVNGAKLPNQYGQDNFSVIITKEKVRPDPWNIVGGSAFKSIISGDEKLYTK